MRSQGEPSLDSLRLAVIQPDGKVNVQKKMPDAQFDPRRDGG